MESMVNAIVAQRVRLLAILEYMYSNENKPVTVTEIGEHLEDNDIPTMLKIVQKDLDVLISLGINIVQSKRNSYSFTVGSKTFSTPEMHVLSEAASTLEIVSDPKASRYIEKLCRLAIVRQTERICEILILYVKIAPENEAVFCEIDACMQKIHELTEMLNSDSFEIVNSSEPSETALLV